MIAAHNLQPISAGWGRRLPLAFAVIQSGALGGGIDFVYGCIGTTKTYAQHLELEYVDYKRTPPPKTEFW